MITESALERIAQLVKAEMSGDPVLFSVGAKELAVQSQSRRVIWVPVAGSVRPPSRLPLLASGSRRYEPLYEARLSVEAHVSALGLAALELLWMRLLAATRKVLKGASQPGSFAIGADGYVQGEYVKLVQTFEFQMFISRDTGVLTSVDGQEFTFGLVP